MSPHARQTSLAGDEGFSRWRQRTLAAAGFEDDLAKRVAADAEIDLHQLLELVDRGCPPHLAARIQAPLKWQDT